MSPSLIRRGFAAALAACPILAASSGADAAVGSIDFKEFKLSLSDANRGPHLPVITVQLIDGKWRASALPVEFALALRVKVDLFSSVTRIRVGVPSVNIPQNSRDVFGGGFKDSGASDVRITNSRHFIPGDRLALVSLDAASRCAQAAAGKTGEFTLPFRIPVEVHVTAVRGIVNVEQRAKTYQAEVPAQIRCVPLSESHSAEKPQRSKVEPKRTKVEPERTALPFAVLTAELAFAKGSAKGCPVEVRQSVRITSKGPGRAKFYLVKQDGKGTLSAAYYVDVKTQQNGVYVGVARVTNVFKKAFTGTYRVLVVRENAKPFESEWSELKVECGPAAGDGKLAPNAPGTSPGKERFDRIKPKVS